MIQIQSRVPMEVWQYLADRAGPRGDMSEVVRTWIVGLYRNQTLVPKVESAGKEVDESPPGRRASGRSGLSR